MDHTGIRILFEGSNGLRLLSGLWTTVEISLLSVIGSVIFGFFTGLFMTLQNRAAKLISRFYLEFIRIMPQLVLLFIAYFGITRAFGISLSGFAASVIVFILWGAAEMGDLVRGALISIPKSQYESAADVPLHHYPPVAPTLASAGNQLVYADHQDHLSRRPHRCRGNAENRPADY